MSLKLYKIDTTINYHPDCTARMETAGGKISSSWLEENDEEIKKTLQSVKFVAREAYNLENIGETDFIRSVYRALLFSERFVEKVGNAMSEDVMFFPCKLICDGVGLDWYVAKIKRRIPIIDKEASTYQTLSGGYKIIAHARYRKDIEEPFFIASDIENGTHFVVSELFMDLCKQNGLLIKFIETEPSCPRTEEPEKPAHLPKEGSEDMAGLKDKILELVQYLNSEKIIEINELEVWSNQTFEDIVALLRKKLQETYPETDPKPQQPLHPRLQNIHYANGFTNEKLKQSAFMLSEIERYLNINKFLDHDAVVEFFNKKITSKGFVVNPTALVMVDIESLFMSSREA